MSRFARVLDALYASRQFSAERVIRQHAHFLAQAEEYERNRALESAKATADANTVGAQGALQFTTRSAA